MEIKKFENFGKINEDISSKGEPEIRKLIQDWFYQKIAYSTQWMIYSESDISDELLPQLEELGYTFDIDTIEYDEDLFKEIVGEITNSIMNNIKDKRE